MEGSEKGITSTFDPGDLRKWKGKWQTKKEYETVVTVRKRFRSMEDGRRTSCPIPSASPARSGQVTSSTSRDNVSTGSNWADAWNQATKGWSMWGEKIEGRSNVKLPLIFSSVEAAMAEFQEHEMHTTLTACKEKNEDKVIAYQKGLDDLYNNADFGLSNAQTFHDTVILGTGITHIAWVKKSHDGDVTVSEKDLKEKLKGNKEIKDQIKSGKPATETKCITEYEGIAEIPISLWEFYVDPDAQCLEGFAYEATDCVWRKLPSVEQFRAEFVNSDDPWVIKENIDKVRSAWDAQTMYGEGSQPFFKSPSDIGQSSKVECLRYYNKQTDRYIVIANDIVIREGPLPYNHKKLPFSLHKYIDFPHMFYGIGLGMVLEASQAIQETLFNLSIDQAHINVAPPAIMDDETYDIVSQQFERIGEPGQLIRGGASVGQDKFRWLEGSQPRGDVVGLINKIEEIGIKISGINPIAYSLPRAGEPVRNNVMTVESTLKQIKKGIKGWAFGKKQAIRQELALMKQFYPLLDEPKSIRLEGEKVYKDDKGKVVSEEIAGTSYLNLTADVLDIDEELDVKIDVDAILPTTRALKMQNIEQAMTQLYPILSNPGLNQMPAVNELIHEYIISHGLSPKISEELRDRSSENEVASAIDQEKAMMGGADVPGIPGESTAHKQKHIETITSATAELLTNPAITPQESEGLHQLITKLYAHMKIDAMPKQIAGATVPDMVMQSIQPPPPQTPQGMPPQGMNGMEQVGGGQMLPPA